MRVKTLMYLCLFLAIAVVYVTYGVIKGWSSFVRKISDLPAGRQDWIVETYQGKVYAISLIHLETQGSENYVACIDPNTEKVIDRFTTKKFTAIAVSAEREQRLDSWLAREYDYWVLDEKSNIAYALKPTAPDNWDPEQRYNGVYVVNLKTHKVEKFLPISPMTGKIFLHPNRGKLYITTEPKEAEIETGEIRIYSVSDWVLLKTITHLGQVILDAKFTKDGNRLFCCSIRGMLVVNTLEDRLEPWDSSPDVPVRFNIEGHMYSLDLSSDEKELYVAIELIKVGKGIQKGGVAAIDIVRKKLARILELSSPACTSVAVVGDKLFAACLDGVYVIDIPAWRKQR
jgi:hypothetical protein